MTKPDKALERVKQSVVDSLPNWEDKSCYPKQETINSDVWAWQFLRRCELYWQEWAEFELLRNRGINLPKQERQIYRRVRGWKWGLKDGLKDPSMTDWDGHIIFLLSPEVEVTNFFDPYSKKRVNLSLANLTETEVCLVFDTALAHKAQLDSANEILNFMSSKFPGFEERAIGIRAPYNNYPLLLRVLDSSLYGASPTVAAGKILPGPDAKKGEGNAELYKKYSRLLTTAKNISRKRYMNIVSHSLRSLS